MDPIIDVVILEENKYILTEQEKSNRAYVESINIGLKHYLLCTLISNLFNGGFKVNLFEIIKEFKYPEFNDAAPEYLIIIQEAIGSDF